ncbi:GYF domain-containing protein [Aequorivita todarodis]|uniref:GYF domain-containing protein n=1 Tax=Aequorivita todarodis TaxID=2036821 RepID=UPI00235038CB|nr:GYF domain-containing protein [Aequorivita todarodis]MDC8001533.1 GYF domain-containing protein [Aequorivita todarodis]
MKKYFYSNDNQKNGPYTFEELKNENIKKETLIWYEGLDDWTKAGDLNEMIPILELNPPSFSEIKQDSELIEKPEIQFEEKNQTFKKVETLGLKKASQGWIIAGFIFSFLGGFLGIAIGFNYAFGNYKKETKTLGWVMAVIGIFSLAIWKSL